MQTCTVQAIRYAHSTESVSEMGNPDRTHQQVVPFSTGSYRVVGMILMIIAVCAAGMVTKGGEQAITLMLFFVCLVIAAEGAYAFPLPTVFLWILSTQAAVEFLSLGSISIGAGIELRYADPVLAAAAGALVFSSFRNPEWTRFVLFRLCWWWTLLFIWLIFLVFNSVRQYGIVPALGEFRSYFQQILIVPYIVLFFRDRKRQRSLLRLLLVTAALFAVGGLLKGWFIFRFTFSAYQKWLHASTMLAVLFGWITVVNLNRLNLLPGEKSIIWPLIVACMALIVITGHRSVWLALFVSVVAMMLMGQISASAVFRAGFTGSGIAILLAFLFSDIDLLAFISERMGAFTSFREDTTASWRLQRWLDALEQVRGSLWTGGGLGRYFRTSGTDASIVIVSLHNQYVQLVYQTGITGLVLYLGFVCQCLRGMWRGYTRTTDLHEYAIHSSGLMVLAAVSAYYVANGFDYMSWLYVGLSLAVFSDVTFKGAGLEYESITTERNMTVFRQKNPCMYGS